MSATESNSIGSDASHDVFWKGTIYYAITSLIVVFGVVFGHRYVSLASHQLAKETDVIGAFANWDGVWYQRIAKFGYSYNPNESSTVAFFPAFPLLGRVVSQVTGLQIDAALLVVAHICLAATFALLFAYLRYRTAETKSQEIGFVVLAFGLWPMTCFFRFAYSESLFVFCAVLSLYAMQQRWPLLLTALIVGLTTATRPVGVALLVPFAWYVWNATTRAGTSIPIRVLDLVYFGALASWGITAYIAYQWVAFGDPLAFAHTQSNWRIRDPVPLGEHIVSLLTLEPLWSVFDLSSPCYWEKHTSEINALFSLQVGGPMYFLCSIALLGIGWRKGWLNRAEIAVTICLLAIPYITRSHEFCMMAIARHSAAAFPLYIVMGHLLSRMPAPIAAAVCGLSAFMLGAYSALFAAWYRIF